jgi:hypothetical protein
MDDILDILVAHGVPGATVVRVAQLIADAKLTQERRTRNADRMRAVRTHAPTSMHTETPGISPSLLPSLSTTSLEKEERLEIVAPGQASPREPKARGEFEAFWQDYPHKVGKRAAATAFDRARRRASFEVIAAGLTRYAGKTDDRPWCNPATWLNQDRWDDQPGPSQEGNGKPGVALAVVEKHKRDLRQQLHAQGLDPYAIEQEIWRRSAGFAQGPDNVTQLRPSGGVVRG